MAWIFQGKSKGKWWYLKSQVGGHSFHRALKTQDRAVAERELEAQLATEALLTLRPNGKHRWQKTEWDRDWLAIAGLRGQTRVSRQRYAFTVRALQVLSDSDRWAWIVNPPKVTILSALGTIESDELLRLTADEIQERKCNTKSACALIHSLMGRHRPARPSTIATALRRAVRYHCTRHPETTGLEIAAVLRNLACDFDKKNGAESDPGAVNA